MGETRNVYRILEGKHMERQKGDERKILGRGLPVCSEDR